MKQVSTCNCGINYSGGSRFSRRGGGPVRGGVDLRHGRFSPKMCAKMKELGPIGGSGPPTQALFTKNVCENERIGSCRGHVPGTPPRSANEIVNQGVK